MLAVLGAFLFPFQASAQAAGTGPVDVRALRLRTPTVTYPGSVSRMPDGSAAGQDSIHSSPSFPRPRTGTVVGAGLGLGTGILLARAMCDVEDCATHPDTYRIVLGSALCGAVIGYLVDIVRHNPGPRTSPER